MDHSEPASSLRSAPSPRRSRRAIVLALLSLVLLATAGTVWWRLRVQPAEGTAPGSDDPRLTYPTPFLNVRPEVGYVGDEACAGCHQGRSESFHHHPMGRSLSAASGSRVEAHLDASGRARFEALGLAYAVEYRDSRLFHKESVPGPGDKEVAAVEAETQFAIGSGRRGAGYLIEDDGYVFQSPISWYPQKGAWDLSPGYRQQNDHFDRPIIAACLFCHSNRVEPVADTINRYHLPVFRGEAIGCERCHGPGELHVRRQRHKESDTGEEDDTIVNPRRLEPALRDAVCEQCHLQGQARVLRRGRGVFDYRPGLPLHLFWSVFVFPPEAAHDHRAVGQVEQMHASRCYQDSTGALGCATCHDAHKLPAEADRTSFYTRRCLECHRAGKDCSLPKPERQAKGDNCVACHMPRSSSTDIAHVAVTDHRILRQPDREPPPPAPRPGEALLIPFHRAPATAGEEEQARDLGLGLMEFAAQAPPGPVRGSIGRLALPLLEKATAAAPDDLSAWEALGRSRRFCDRLPDALGAYEAALARAPGRELAVTEAAGVAGQMGKIDLAIDYWQRGIRISPRRPHYHHQLALLLLRREQIAEALEHCETALRLNPASVEARVLEVVCLLKKGQKEQARTAFDRLMALKPVKEEELRRWFATQVP